MESQWFTKKPNEARRGPFSEGELRRQALGGELARTDLIWCEGLDMAIPAGSLPGLFPPPPPRMPAPEPMVMPPKPGVAEPPPRQDEEKIKENEEEDTFSWYRPGDSRTPMLVNWMPFWQLVHRFGSRNKRVYTLLPLMATLPLGLAAGALATAMPLVIIDYLIVIGLGILFGESVYECCRLKNGGQPLAGAARTRAMLFGFGAAMLLAYFYTVGGFFVDLYRLGLSDRYSAFDFFLPWNVVRYLHGKMQYTIVAKLTQVDNSTPIMLVNLFTIGLEYFLLIYISISLSGGAKKTKQQKSSTV